MYNQIKRDIKTVVLRYITKVKQRGRKKKGSIDANHPPRVFVEIGTGHTAEWTYLIRDNWQEIALRKRWTDRLRAIPDMWLSHSKTWHGYLVEAHPSNFCSLVEKTLADKTLCPFLHRLTFINAAISSPSQFSTMGMETGIFKKLFVNRFSLTGAQPFHQRSVNNTLDFHIFTVSLDTLLSALGHTHIDLLRLDVEGAEVPILQAYSWHVKPTLISVEHHSPEGKNIIQGILVQQGYRIDSWNTEEVRYVYEKKFSDNEA